MAKNTASVAALSLLLLAWLWGCAAPTAEDTDGYIYIGLIYIKPDGSVDPPQAPIQRLGDTYAFTANIRGRVTVQRDDIVIDGSGYTLRGGREQGSRGFLLESRKNVTIKNVKIVWHMYGVLLYNSTNINVYGNYLLDNWIGIHLDSGSNNTIYCNTITRFEDAINLFSSSNNTIYGNIAQGFYSCDPSESWSGIRILDGSSSNRVFGNVILNVCVAFDLGSLTPNPPTVNNTIYDNTIIGCPWGFQIVGSPALPVINNTIYDNTIAYCKKGMFLWRFNGNILYHNNFVNNTIQVVLGESVSNWDDGYPSGGNYWSDYNGTDLYSGPNQNEPGSDGIGDTPYVIDANNTDRYPLMNPYVRPRNIEVNITPSKIIVGQGFNLTINLTIKNPSTHAENLYLFAYANATFIQTQNITMTAESSTTITFKWNTTGFAKGYYNITATTTSIINETQEYNSAYSVLITIPGDVDGDFDVDIYDIVKVCVAYGSKMGDSRYIPERDINDDNKIDIYDVVIACSHYRQTIP